MSEGPAVDHREFREAVETDFARIPFDELLADTGYKYERHHVLIREELKARSPIPPRIERPSNQPPLGQSRRQFARQFPRRRFRLRWQIESGPSTSSGPPRVTSRRGFSQDKRRFGSSI